MRKGLLLSYLMFGKISKTRLTRKDQKIDVSEMKNAQVIDSRYKNKNKKLKPKQNKNWTYQYTYLMRIGLGLCYLICFVKYWKSLNGKKVENWQKSELKNAKTQLYSRHFVGMQEYTLICVFENIYWF